ncbi:MAG: hypothetical protein Q4G10_08115, partial [Bacteroidia bacterium]|nr:hypothetical protein [Bacteroidia bacterium]
FKFTMDLNKWWSGLKISEKERIAGKILSKNPDLNGPAEYPYCTDIWLSLDEEKQTWIYKHCFFKHGYLDKIDFEGEPYSE